jgi:hypothetical protein
MLPSRPLSGLMQSYAPRRPVHERLGAPPSATGHVAGADLPTRPEASPQTGAGGPPNASVPGEDQAEDLGPMVGAQQASLFTNSAAHCQPAP